MSLEAQMDNVAAERRPGRVRYRVVGLMVLMAMVTYLDRVCIAKLAPNIMEALSLSKVQMGYVFSAFALAYALFEVPTAWWADRFGTHRVLTRIVSWWSGLTLATAGAFNYASLLVVRFLFGAGEAGAWPCANRTFARWVPQQERGRVQGIFFAGAHLAGGLTPVLVTVLLGFLSWRVVFVCFALAGMAWVMVWQRWFRDEPSEHPEVGQAELELIQAGCKAQRPKPTGRLRPAGRLRWENLAALCLMYFPNSFVFYFCITWLPTYLKEQHGFDAGTLGFLAGLPLLLSVLGDLLGGVVSDWASARFGLRVGRSGVGAAAYMLAGAALFAAAVSHRPVLSAVMIALAVAATMFTLAAAWSTCIDAGGDHPGMVSAAMNTSGQVGSMLCPLLVAYTLKWFGSWNISLYVMGGLFLAGAGAWCAIDPRQKVFEEGATGAGSESTLY